MKETKTMYAVFQVYDYKGGELRAAINLSFDHFIGNLVESFENYNIEEDQPLDYYKEKVTEILKNKYDFYSTYAGGDGFCGNLYKIENNIMEEVQFEDYIEDIAKVLMNP